MRRISLDSETYLIAPGLPAPRMVCLTTCDEDGDTSLLLRADALPVLHALFDTPDIEFVAHHARFDMAVFAAADASLLPKIMRLYDEGRVRCTMLREKLLALARGELADEGDTGAKRNIKFSLAACVERRFGVDLSAAKSGPDVWRLRYSELDGVPTAAWPASAREYAVDDARWNLAVFDGQTAELHREGGSGNVIPDERAQARAAFWLYLMSMRGVRTDPVAVNALATRTRAAYERMNAVIRAADILRPKMEKGEMVWSKNMGALRDRVTLAYGGSPPLTEKGAVATDRKTMVKCADPRVLAWVEQTEQEIVDARKGAGLPEFTAAEMAQVARDVAAAAGEQFNLDPERVYNWMALHAVGERSGVEKILTTYVPTLFEGTQGPICTSYNELVASGRGSAYNPNLQNPPRKGGIRECFVPRPGYLYALCDYSFVELVTLAQTCLDMFGWSKLADAINAGLDPHLDMAASDLGIPYAEALRRKADPDVTEYRQRAKARNFGFPGGLGAGTYVAYAEGYGVFLTEHEAKQEKEKWFAKWPEMRLYYDHFGRLTLGDQKFTAIQLPTGRVRGGVGFCDGCNTFFQGRAADGIKRAGWYVTKECYLRDPYPADTEYEASGPVLRALARLCAGIPGGSPLYGSRPVLFLHDELILEVPEQTAAEAAKRLSDVMIEGMREVVPDVRVGTEYALVRRWYKGAGPAYDATGRLIPWEPRKRA